MTPTRCGWCGQLVLDWYLDGLTHRWGACVDKEAAARRERDHLESHRRTRAQESRLHELRTAK